MRCGIARGGPRSLVLGRWRADLEATLAQHGFLVMRCIEDLLRLPPTRETLRTAVRLVQHGLAALG